MPPRPTLTNITLQGPNKHGILWLKYNRPQSGNSLHPSLVADALQALHWANTSPTVKIIIITGEGRFFCTGMDLTSPDDEQLSFAPGGPFHQLNEALIRSEKIVVAAVNGPAVGFGVSSLALCDLVYAVSDAYFSTPFVKWGMVPEAAASVTFARIMGHQRAARLCLMGERITAEEARELGLVSTVLPREGFLERVLAEVEGIAGAPAGSLRATKTLMREPVISDLLEANDRECRMIHEERMPSGDPQRGRVAFQAAQREKRDGGRL
ncbi:hypothetical protein BDW74DRAFT_174331 [Aspergillus multicolor]|uniref:enoyl-CoA hydratase/isomerase family protein n=1 Tax=Aspergillus multicolor TaxID=41759 RepID=UPI003CCE23C1